MARITDTLVVQRVESLIVIMDDSTGAEIEFPAGAVPNVIAALKYLAPEAQDWQPPSGHSTVF